ncbi:MAG: NADH-quinone oxidoreductase subunit C [Sphingomicrobium sp.]
MLASQVPQTASNEGLVDAATAAIGAALLEAKDLVGEVTLTVARDSIVAVLTALRDTPGLEFQQLMEMAGVDYPDRAERFEVVYHLLSLTLNRRIRVKLSTDEVQPVPSVTALWPVAGWLEREIFDMYGVAFAGNSDLRRILTDYGFEGHPQRKDFPLTGHVEMRYSEAEKRVVYEPVSLPQDFRNFDFLMPWEGPEYFLPGDEKGKPEQPGETPRTTEKPSDTGGGAPANAQAHTDARKSSKAKAESEVSKPGATPDPKPKGAGRRPGGGAA